MELSEKHIKKLHKYFSSKPIKRAFLFGSYARNEANTDSDVDILVELDHSQPIGMKFFVFQEELKNILNLDVDLVSENGVSKHLKPFINRDKLLIYERQPR